ncbi:MAG: serine hydrolase [Myxococcales bacterium]|nr:serine hydrolase [Myxococcales bacterium]
MLLPLLLLIVATRSDPVPAPEFTPLRETANSELQAGLEQVLVELKLQNAAKRKAVAVALAGISDLDCPRFAHVNGDHMMYAASLPKIAILLAALRRDQDGELTLTRKDTASLRAMIRKSSNRDATRMLERVGREYVNELLQSEAYRLYDPGHNGGLWVGKPYSSEGAFERDPLHNLSHGATAIQVARFFYLLETGHLLDPDHSARMKSILVDPGIFHKFVAGLRRVRPRAQLYRKSGTWREYHADAVLVERTDGRRYIAVAMAHDRKGESWLRQLIVAIDALIDRAPPPCADG